MPAAVRVLALVVACLALTASASAANRTAKDTAPSNTSLPTLTGTAQQGKAMTVQSGSWSGTNPIVFAYQWKRCNSSGASCSDISGATAQTYTLVAADVGSTLRISVSATNSAGTGTALSDPSSVVTSANAPVNTTAPSISGSAQQGATLTAATGAWSGATPISYAYQWQRCDSHGANCATIGGATTESYSPSSAGVGNTVRVEVTASNSGGSSSAFSGSSAVIAGLGDAPVNTAVPTLSGSTLEGSPLTVTQGSWQGSAPLTFAFGWQRCDASGNNCTTISGAGAAKYTLARADVGNRVRGVVTGSNGNGRTTAYTALSDVVGSLLEPVNTTLPAISGSVAVGQTLNATTGAWSGATPLSFFYQWALSNGKGGFDPIAGATQQTFKLTSADLGHQLFVQVKAQNSHGPAWADSKPTAAVASTAAAPGVISVSAVSLPDRLVISKATFTPNVIRTRSAFHVRFVVTDSQGHPVQGALVYAVGLPYGWIKSTAEQQTGADGSVTLTVAPTTKLPVGHRGALVMFVRTRKPGGSALAGVSTRRLIQVQLR
jgi:hypothetical protein